MGVRGVSLGQEDKVISLSILHHFEATGDERAAYLKRANALRRRMGEDVSPDAGAAEVEEAAAAVELSDARFYEMQAAEQIILTVSENGYGKRTSSYEYRTTGRGGKGIVAMAVNARNGKLVASFPVGQDDEIMLVTDGGQLIRCPVEGIRIAGRGTQGVIVFNTADDERVVSVEHIGDVGEGDEGEGEGEE
jgi:DNA gyrase subunit A